MKYVYSCVIIAAVLWGIMFSPWTAPIVPFWRVMAASGILLTYFGYQFGGNPFKQKPNILCEVAMGVGIAVVLWGVFWVGDKLSQLMFSFARPQVDGIYSMKADTPEWLIALFLLFIIGPAEELFWRGYVQRSMTDRWGAWTGFIGALACYTAIHLWSGNFMLIMAAGVCGFCWGILYRFFPKHLLALVISHALWDVAAFVVFPF